MIIDNQFNLKKMDSEITNRCNAACTLCPRTGTYPGGLGKEVYNSGPLDISLDVIEECLGWPIKKWQYCGNYGDPMAHPKVFDIAEMVSKSTVDAQQFDTNGSMRSTQFWKELGGLPNNMIVNFALDGLSDTNHIYRTNTNFEKIIENAKAFMAGGGIARWIFIVFNHNEHQVEEARDMARKLGFDNFAFKKTSRQLERGSTTAKKEYKKSSKSETVTKSVTATKRLEFQADTIKRGVVEHVVSCKALGQKKMYVTPKGQLIPCCHVHQDLFKNEYNPEFRSKNDEMNFTTWLDENNVKYDLNKYTIFEVMKSYRENLDSIEDRWFRRSLRSCNKKCGSNLRNEVVNY